MYNGIGLSTTRGSGTNGYVQQNKALVRQNFQRVDYKRDDFEKDTGLGFNKAPNKDILLHDKKRQVEIKCLELQDELEEKGLKEDDIEERVSALRRKLLQNLDSMTRNVKDLKGHESHFLAEAKSAENERLAKAFGINSKNHKEGSAFDVELQEKKKQERIILQSQRDEERRKAFEEAKARQSKESQAEGGQGRDSRSEDRKGRESRVDEHLITLRSYWEFAAVSQFLHLFYEAFNLTEFVTETLEEQLLSEWPPTELMDMQVKMLRVLTQNRLINTDTWAMYFRREVLKRFTANYIFPEENEYFNLPLRNKYDYPERFRQAVKNDDESNHWRVDPVGWDAAGNTYWLFDDNRLYKEEPVGKKKKGRPSKTQEINEGAKWTVQCITVEDWITFPERFQNTRNQLEKTFYEFLTVHALPQVLPDLEEKEKKKKLEEAVANRKRSTRLQMREVHRLEEERIALFERDRRIKEKRNDGIDEYEEEDPYDGLEDSRRLRRRKVAPEPPKPDASKEREERLRRRGAGTNGAYSELSSTPISSHRSSSRSAKKKQVQPEPDYESRENSPSWFFNCTCGLKGHNVDDGNPMTACGRCLQWQHLRCAAISEGLPGDISAQEWENRDFLCVQCREEVGNEVDVTGDMDDKQDIDMDEKPNLFPEAPEHEESIDTTSVDKILDVPPVEAAHSPLKSPVEDSAASLEERNGPLGGSSAPMGVITHVNGNGVEALGQ
ncbi:RNA-splicing factor [Dinochytrium kinnereticum]|nr:RNA-splicing factor [Dinochytrium kinnereticum]